MTKHPFDSLVDERGDVFQTPPTHLLVPRDIALDGNLLIWSDDEPRGKRLAARVGLQAFKSFLALDGATPNDVLRYAQKYGVLNLCREHDLPFWHKRTLHRYKEFYQQSCRVRRRNGRYAEPVSAWLAFAREASAIVRIITHLRDGKPGGSGDWTIVKSRTSPIRPVFIYPISAPEYQRFALSVYLNSWVDATGVRLRFRWSGSRTGKSFEPTIVGDLLAYIALELVALFAEQRHGIDVCSICYQPFRIGTRLPRAGERHLCEKDGCRQKANTLAQRRRRNRPRAPSR